jgi:hypothetical protein
MRSPGPRGATKHPSQIILLAIIVIAGGPEPAHASGDPMAALLMFAGGPSVQILEGFVFAAVARRVLSGDAGLAIFAYALGSLASWGIFLSRWGLDLVERLAAALAPAPDAVNGMVYVVFLLLVVLVGPASAAVAILVSRGIRVLSAA